MRKFNGETTRDHVRCNVLRDICNIQSVYEWTTKREEWEMHVVMWNLIGLSK
jgi:hypothetical protein